MFPNSFLFYEKKEKNNFYFLCLFITFVIDKLFKRMIL